MFFSRFFLSILCCLSILHVYALESRENISLDCLDDQMQAMFKQADTMDWPEIEHPELSYVISLLRSPHAHVPSDILQAAISSLQTLVGSNSTNIFSDLCKQKHAKKEQMIPGGNDLKELTRNPALDDRTAFVNIIMGNQGELKFQELSTNGTNIASIQAPASLVADYTLTLPGDAGSSGQVLQTNGSGVLSWVTAASGDIVNGGQTGPITIGTNNATALELETDGTSRLFVDSAGNTSYTTNYKANVRVGSNQNVTGTETIEFDTVTYDLNGNFNTGTHLYTAPLTGYYLVMVNLSGDYSNNNVRTLALLRNGSTVTGYSMQTDRRTSANLLTIIDLNAGDTLGAQLTNGGGTAVIRANHTSMVIHFISR